MGQGKRDDILESPPWLNSQISVNRGNLLVFIDEYLIY